MHASMPDVPTAARGQRAVPVQPPVRTEATLRVRTYPRIGRPDPGAMLRQWVIAVLVLAVVLATRSAGWFG
jgi:hypothetical protein